MKWLISDDIMRSKNSFLQYSFMSDKVSINFNDLRELRSRVITIRFLKKSFNIEAVIRWLIDRNFSYVNFHENSEYFVFRQNKREQFNTFEIRVLEGEGIEIELGVN